MYKWRLRPKLSYPRLKIPSQRAFAASSIAMRPQKPLPYSDDFADPNEYIDSLLTFATTSQLFQTLCGGVHILDFFTRDPSLYTKVIPQEWQPYLLPLPSSSLLDLLMRDDISAPRDDPLPDSLRSYILQTRKHMLIRTVQNDKIKNVPEKLPHHVAVGMIPKKTHEVSTFAKYVSNLSDSLPSENHITHFVDFGSGQNYLGRALASPPYNKHIIAVESRTVNIKGANRMDVSARIAEREKVMRNKKLYRQHEMEREIQAGGEVSEKEWRKGVRDLTKMGKCDRNGTAATADFRPIRELGTVYTPPERGRGYVHYIQRRLSNGDLSDVISQIPTIESNVKSDDASSESTRSSSAISSKINGLALSLHSCGNLSHHGIRSLILNPDVKAIAIIGCCYNLLTSSLPSPLAQSSKHPLLRPDLRAINSFTQNKGRTKCTIPAAEREEPDEHGFPMSEHMRNYGGEGGGIRFNITSRSMAVQAPANWSESDSEKYFERHFWRALLQKMFLDYGVVKKIHLVHGDEQNKVGDWTEYATQPIIVGTLSNSCFKLGFQSYVKGALDKLITKSEDESLKSRLMEMREVVTNEVVAKYEEEYDCKKRELSIVWSLMAFSAQLVESIVVVDRWLFLREHVGEDEGMVKDVWVEALFDYGSSPRNLVIVGVK